MSFPPGPNDSCLPVLSLRATVPSHEVPARCPLSLRPSATEHHTPALLFRHLGSIIAAEELPLCAGGEGGIETCCYGNRLESGLARCTGTGHVEGASFSWRDAVSFRK
jgi:hypothetical protein